MQSQPFLQLESVRRRVSRGRTQTAFVPLVEADRTIRAGDGLKFGNNIVTARNMAGLDVLDGQLLFFDTIFSVADAAGVGIADYGWDSAPVTSPWRNVVKGDAANATTGNTFMSSTGIGYPSGFYALAWGNTADGEYGKFMVQGIHPRAHVLLDATGTDEPVPPGNRLGANYTPAIPDSELMALWDSGTVGKNKFVAITLTQLAGNSTLHTDAPVAFDGLYGWE